MSQGQRVSFIATLHFGKMTHPSVLPQRRALKAMVADKVRVAAKRAIAGNIQSRVATSPRGRRKAIPGP